MRCTVTGINLPSKSVVPVKSTTSLSLTITVAKGITSPVRLSCYGTLVHRSRSRHHTKDNVTKKFSFFIY